jgi:hypothetical protein
MRALGVQYGDMVRMLVALALVAWPLAAAAATPGPAGTASPPGRHDGGMIAGRLSAVDYQHGTIRVESPARGRVDFDVMPSTSIQTHDAGYHSITDLRVGEHVEVYSSVNGQRYVAQIIRIR